MTERIDLLLTHLQFGGDGRARIETEVFGTRQYSVEIDDGRTVVRFVDIRTGRPVTLVAARGSVTLEDARQQQDVLHITTIAVISEKGETVPIVKRPLEAGATPTRSDVVPFARPH